MTSLKYYLLVLITPLVLSCSSSLNDYENTTLEFDLPTYFDGEVTANCFAESPVISGVSVVKSFCISSYFQSENTLGLFTNIALEGVLSII
jgi:hypothetical protein